MTNKGIVYKIKKIEGKLDLPIAHMFIVGYDIDSSLVYAGKDKSRSEVILHSDLANSLQINPLGGGYCTLSSNILYVYGYSEKYGAVPREVLEKFNLMDAYKKIHSKIDEIRLWPSVISKDEQKWKNMGIL